MDGGERPGTVGDEFYGRADDKRARLWIRRRSISDGGVGTWVVVVVTATVETEMYGRRGRR